MYAVLCNTFAICKQISLCFLNTRIRYFWLTSWHFFRDFFTWRALETWHMVSHHLTLMARIHLLLITLCGIWPVSPRSWRPPQPLWPFTSAASWILVRHMLHSVLLTHWINTFPCRYESVRPTTSGPRLRQQRQRGHYSYALTIAQFWFPTWSQSQLLYVLQKYPVNWLSARI